MLSAVLDVRMALFLGRAGLARKEELGMVDMEWGWNNIWWSRQGISIPVWEVGIGRDE